MLALATSYFGRFNTRVRERISMSNSELNNFTTANKQVNLYEHGKHDTLRKYYKLMPKKKKKKKKAEQKKKENKNYQRNKRKKK